LQSLTLLYKTLLAAQCARHIVSNFSECTDDEIPILYCKSLWSISVLQAMREILTATCTTAG